MRVGAGRSRLGLLGRGLSGLAVVVVLTGAALIATHGQRAAAASSPPDASAAEPGVTLGKSGLPIPRFVSLKAGRVNVRVGPGEDYKVSWVFTKPALPVEVIQEFDTWRRIRDSDGAVGWVFHSLLSGKRTAVVTPWAGGDAAYPRPWGGEWWSRPISSRASRRRSTAAAAAGAIFRGRASPAGSSRASSGASIPTRRSTSLPSSVASLLASPPMIYTIGIRLKYERAFAKAER